MTLAVNIMHGHGPSNKIHHQLQAKKTNLRKAVLVVNIATKVFYALFIAKKTEHTPFC